MAGQANMVDQPLGLGPLQAFVGSSRAHDFFIIFNIGDIVQMVDVDLFYLQLAEAFVNLIIDLIGSNRRLRRKDDWPSILLRAIPTLRSLVV